MKKINLYTGPLLIIGFLLGILLISCLGGQNKEIIKTVTINVKGMHCDSCSEGLTAVLGKLEGVKEAKVTYDPNDAVIEYDESKVTVEDILAKIKDAGYSAKVVKAGEK